MEKVPTTAEGLRSLDGRAEEDLKSVERPAIIKAIAAAREHGDLSENAEYTSARERQSFIEGRIGELENIISRADVIDLSKLSGKVVKFGATVQLCRRGHRQEGEIPDRRPLRGRPHQGAHLGDLADRPRPDRQDRRRHRRRSRPRAARAPTRSWASRSTKHPSPFGGRGLRPPPRAAGRLAVIAAYWIRNRPILLEYAPGRTWRAAQVLGSSDRARAMLSAAEPNISPAQT